MHLYPAITAPLTNKNLSEGSCPAEHLAAVHDLIPQCTKVLVVGSSGLGELEAVRLFAFVDGGNRIGDTLGAWERFITQVPALAKANQFAIDNTGFRRFTENGELEAFAEGRRTDARIAEFKNAYESMHADRPLMSDW